MLACPNCATRLKRQSIDRGVIYACPSCGGRTMGLGLLHKVDVADDFMRELWKKAVAPGAAHLRQCPHCGRYMSEVRNEFCGQELVLDVCTLCQSVWFDPNEYKALPTKEMMPREELSPEARLAIAKAEIALMEDNRSKHDLGAPPDEPWQKAITFLGLPAVIDDNKITVRPYLIWGLALACVLIYTIFARRMGSVALSYGFIPEIWYRLAGVTMVTSFFLHGGLLHLGANIYFLLVFGDHLEGLLGRWRLLSLTFGSHLAGLMAHYMLFPHSMKPLIGASAGIAGILAYYAVSFPRAQVSLLWFGPFRGLYWIRLPVLLYLAVFIFGEIFTPIFSIGGPSNVAGMAHLGGLVVGICAAIWARTNRELRPIR
jgi:membrane associated rhomboid family serine protease/Zn-finger nucleic acid-binding protein